MMMKRAKGFIGRFQKGLRGIGAAALMCSVLVALGWATPAGANSYPALTWNTFLGSKAQDDGSAIAVDGSGNVYVTGRSFATWGAPVCPHLRKESGDPFVAKLSSDGALIWNTFLGSINGSMGYGIAVDGSGNVYVAGNSFEGAGNFVAKLSSAGTLIWNWNTSLSGYINGIAVDGSGNVYVTGYSSSTWGTPVRAYSGDWDAFAAKLSSEGTLIWNTFLGGNHGIPRWKYPGDDSGESIAVDGSGNVYVAGYSSSTWGTPVRAHSGHGYCTFAAKLSNDGTLIWNTFLGSAEGRGIAVDGSGNVYVTGYSSSTWGTPVRAYSGDEDAFAARLSSEGTLIWNTFLGSNREDWGNAIAVDGSGNVYVGGYSYRTWGSPERPYSASEWSPNNFAARLSSEGTLIWNTFLGSEVFGGRSGIAVDGSGSVYVVGQSERTWGSPVRAYSGGWDAFVWKEDYISINNHHPNANISSPVTGKSYYALANLSILVDATDEDGSIDKVEIYANDNLIGTVTNRPYSFKWSKVPSGNYTLIAKATDNYGATATSTPVKVRVWQKSDLALAVTDSPDPQKVGGLIFYSMVVKNRGPDNAQNVVVTDVLPTGVQYVSAISSQGTCNKSGSTISCSLGNLDMGDEATVEIVVMTLSSGVLSNTSTVTAKQADLNKKNNTKTVTTTVTP
jgi:uncharacterized repeat protein (TIGR01451 family)